LKLLSNPEYYRNLGVTAGEVGAALLIGGLSGLVVGLILGGNRLLATRRGDYRNAVGVD
jgi:hypothetical protein